MTSPFALNRLVIRGDLEVLTPLHVGSGDSAPDEAIPVPEGNTEPPESARVVLDYDGKPYIPGSSLKGVLRAVCPKTDESKESKESNESKALFGTPHDDKGEMGLLTVYGAPLKNPAKNSHLQRYGDPKLPEGVGHEARTAIDAGKGTAEKNKLFHQQLVAKKSVFAFHAEMTITDKKEVNELAGKLLGYMEDVEGFSLGRGTRGGLGRVQLKITSLKVEGVKPDGSWGALGDKPPVVPDPNHGFGATTFKLRFECDGPYLVNDSSWDENLKKLVEEERKKAPKLKALGTFSKPGDIPPEAILPGSSLKGALRSRCLWLDMLANGNDTLTKTIFGTEERAAELRIVSIAPKKAATWTLTSVKLDRFSGAPIEGALFSALCFADPVFIVEFAGPKSEGAKGHWETLKTDLNATGIRLGHGGNRGFGWFKVTSVAEEN